MFSTLVSINFGSPLLGNTVRENCIKFQTVYPEICPISISEKRLGLVSPPHFAYDFSRKITFMLHSLDRPNFIV